MLRKASLIMFVVVLSLVAVVPAFADSPRPEQAFGEKTEVVVYVTSLGLYFDSIVGPALPMQGPFQQLFPPGTNPDWDGGTLSTEFGPGTPGHHGGRWWVDVNEDGEMNEGDAFFSCPLLGPGRALP
jgi:hypothetical protein